jgi:hypothetical protein
MGLFMPALVVFVVTSCALFDVRAQDAANAPMTNADVISLHRAGLSSEIIVNAVGQAPSRRFDLSPAALLELKSAGVGEAVILAMQNTAALTPLAVVEVNRPPSLAQAHTAYVVNAAVGPNWIKTGDRFKELIAELRKWRRFELVDTPERADAVITLGTASSGQSGAVILGNIVVAASSPVYTLTIQQRATGTVLWASSEQVGSFSVKGTLQKLLKRLREQVPPLTNR